MNEPFEFYSGAMALRFVLQENTAEPSVFLSTDDPNVLGFTLDPVTSMGIQILLSKQNELMEKLAQAEVKIEKLRRICKKQLSSEAVCPACVREVAEAQFSVNTRKRIKRKAIN